MSTIVQYPARQATAALRPRAAAAQPELTRQERLISTVYLVMGALILAFLTATSVVWALGV
jgi:hypothetical protein